MTPSWRRRARCRVRVGDEHWATSGTRSARRMPLMLKLGRCDWQRAQTLADHLSPAALHQVLDRYAKQCCPVFDVFAPSYHWSFVQIEYATDLVFRSQAVLKPLYEQLARQAILTVKAEHVATCLGHK